MALFQIQQANNKLKITFGTPGCQSYYNGNPQLDRVD